MTITSAYAPAVFNGSGSNGPFSVSFPILNKSFVKVEHVVDGVVTQLTEGTGTDTYSITLISAGLGGFQIFTDGNIITGERLIVSRITPRTQLEKLTNLRRFNSEIHEKALDKITQVLQEQEYAGSNAILFPTADATGLNKTLPVDTVRAGKVLAFDEFGQPIVSTTDANNVIAAQAARDDAEAAQVAAEAAAATLTGKTNFWAGTTTGSANIHVGTPSENTTNAAGTNVFGIWGFTNTSSTATFQLGANAALPLKQGFGGGVVNIAQGGIVAGSPFHLQCDGTNWILMNPRQYALSQSVASSATPNLSLTIGDYVSITGTTGITGFTLGLGQERTLIFAGILTLTNGANLILPTGANITTAANDVCVVRGEASGVVRVIAYHRANGTAVASPSLQKQVYTSGSGNFTTPANINASTIFKITGVGGGGSGGASTTGVIGPSGGGAGATFIKWVTGLSPSTNYAYAVGTGGAAASAASANVAGNAGASTTFNDGVTTYTAAGGGGGAATSLGSAGGAGGSATNGDINIIGGDGHSGFHGGSSAFGGNGGSSSLGGGGRSGASTAGTAGRAAGSGGGAASGAGTLASGAGAAGLITIEWMA